MNKIDTALRELGHPENLTGTRLLRMAARMYVPGMLMTKELYPALARATGSTPSRVERSMRHSIESAWLRCPIEVQNKWFGNTINPNTGKPTVGEYVATVARICGEGLPGAD